MADNNFKITVSNDDGKLRAGQQNQITITANREKIARTVNLLMKYPDGTLSETKSVTIKAKENPKDISIDYTDLVFNAKVNDNFSGGYVIIGIPNNEKTDIKDVLATFPLFPSSGSARLVHVYWSSQEGIKDISKEESKSGGEFCKNEDAFLHIKTLGLYKREVKLTLTCAVNGKEEVICKDRNVPLGENSKTVVIYGAEIINFIERENNKTCTSDISITATVNYTPNMLLLSDRDVLNNYLPGYNTSGNIMGNIMDNIKQTLQTATITLKCTDKKENLQKSVYTVGRVLVEAAEENSNDEDTEAKNFLIGCIGKLEGKGKTGTSGSNKNKTISLYNIQLYNLYVFDFINASEISITEKDVSECGKDRKAICEKLKGAITDSGNLKYKALEALLAEARKRRRSRWEQDVCRDAWYAIDYKMDSSRYGKNQECPPGPMYIIPINGDKFKIFVSQKGSSASINRKVDRGGVQEDIKPSRNSIAFHTGDSYWSQGCITLNTNDGRKREIALFDWLFTGLRGEYKLAKIKNSHIWSDTFDDNDKKNKKTQDDDNDKKEKTNKEIRDDDQASHLRLFIIEERGVTDETPINCVKDLLKNEWIRGNNPKNDYRYYHHVKPTPLPLMMLRKVELKITYTETEKDKDGKTKKDKDGKDITKTINRGDTFTPEITANKNNESGGKVNELKACAGDTIDASVVETSYVKEDFDALSVDEKKQIKWELKKKGNKKTDDEKTGIDYEYTVPSNTSAGTVLRLSVWINKQSDCFIFNITIEDAPKTDTTKTQKK
jgi:hypothetical protein